MRTATRPRKPPWSPDRWIDFHMGCVALQLRLGEFIQLDLPPTRGLLMRHVQALVKAHDSLVRAIAAAEQCWACQDPHPASRYQDGFQLLHGHEARRFRCLGRRSNSDLTRHQWIKLGRRLQEIEHDIGRLGLEIQETATVPYVDRFLRAERTLNVAKSRLDGLVHQQHPDWPEAGTVFYESAPWIRPSLEEGDPDRVNVPNLTVIN